MSDIEDYTIGFHACETGDCDHIAQSDCDKALHEYYKAELASIKQQVVFVEAGEEAQVGDLITHIGMRGFRVTKIVQIGDKKEYLCDRYVLSEAQKDYQIIQRAGKPVLVRK